MFDAAFDAIAATLAWFYQLWPSYGAAIILLTLSVMIVLTPLTLKGTRSMMKMQRLQPEIKKLQKEYKDDRQKLNEETMKFYKENQINPLGGCLPLLVQMPVFIVLFQVLRGLTRIPEGSETFDPKYLDHSSELYQALSDTNQMDWLGIDLARTPSQALSDSFVTALPYLAMVLIVLVTSYVQQKQVSGRNPNAEVNPQQQMLLKIMPLMLGVFSFTFQGALNLYFMTSNFWRMGQQWFIGRHIYGKDEDGKPIETTARDDTSLDPDAPRGLRALLGGQFDAARNARAGNGPAASKGGSNGSSKPKPKSGPGTSAKPGSSGKTGSAKSNNRSGGGRTTPKGSSSLPQPRPRKKKRR